jgi:hypothetical protein
MVVLLVFQVVKEVICSIAKKVPGWLQEGAFLRAHAVYGCAFIWGGRMRVGFTAKVPGTVF